MADIDGDGFLVLDEVYQLLFELDEEPTLNDTWAVLDANAARDDLISQSEFLVFISIKRNDDEGHVAGAARPDQQSNVTDAMRKEGVKRRRQIANKARRRSGTVDLLLGHSRRLGDYMRTVYLDRLPPLGEFAVEGLGEERARLLQRLGYIFRRTRPHLRLRLLLAAGALAAAGHRLAQQRRSALLHI